MMYATGSKMYKAIVLFAGMVSGHAGCCHGGQCSAEPAGNGSGSAMMNDMDFQDFDASKMNFTDEELDRMDDEDLPEQIKENHHQQSHQQERPVPPTDEELNSIKERLGLTAEDMETIQGYVGKIPPALKDPSFNDEEIARMFVKHYSTLDDNEKYEPQSREDLIEEIRHLVEEELPQAMAAHQQQQEAAAQQAAEGGEEFQAEQTPEELERELEAMDEELPKTDL